MFDSVTFERFMHNVIKSKKLIEKQRMGDPRMEIQAERRVEMPMSST